MLLAASAVALIVTLTAAALVDRLNSSPRDEPALTAASSMASHRTSPSPTSDAVSTTTPATTDYAWQQIWTADIDQFSQETADTRINDDYLIVYDQKDGTNPRLHGYSLSSGTPQELWSRDRTSGPVALTSSALVTYQGLIDPATGEDIEVPWERQSIVVLATEDTIITCLHRTPTCTGWDLSDGVVSLRWGPVDLPGENSPSFSIGVSPLGYPVVDGITLAKVFDGHKIPSIVFISLADGKITGTQDPTSISADVFPAADGWLLIHGIEPDLTISSLAPDGTQIESYTATDRRSLSTLLLSDSGVPTLEQYRAAFSQGDTSWASVSLHCGYKNACSNGRSSVTGGDTDLYTRPVLLHGMTTSTYQNYLIISNGVSRRYGGVRILDLDHNRIIPLPPPLLDHRAKVAIARDGHLIAITESGLAAYTPAH